ncbi:MAG: histidine phosphatase family protein [Symploca sp. SIO3E6]|nr:histidine phosphatase family protein [Caldora sp. SIO3E6]
MRIYLIRHGDPDYSTDSLTASGSSEAEELAKFVGTLNLDKIYTSPLGRARETASYSETVLGMKAEVLEWTSELKLRATDGSDLAAWDMNPESLRDPEIRDDEAWHQALQKIVKESDVWLERFGWKRSGYCYRYVAGAKVPRGVQVALFCHGGFGLTWLSHLLNIPMRLMWSSFFLHTSSVTTILFDERSQLTATPRVISLSALSHLYKRGIAPSTAGIKANYF